MQRSSTTLSPKKALISWQDKLHFTHTFFYYLLYLINIRYEYQNKHDWSICVLCNHIDQDIRKSLIDSRSFICHSNSSCGLHWYRGYIFQVEAVLISVVGVDQDYHNNWIESLQKNQTWWSLSKWWNSRIKIGLQHPLNKEFQQSGWQYYSVRRWQCSRPLDIFIKGFMKANETKYLDCSKDCSRLNKQ